MAEIIKSLNELSLDGYTIFYGRQLMAAAMFTSKDESRPILNAVQMVVKDDRITLAATDSYRLGMFTIANVLAHQDDATFLIDVESVKQSKLLSSKPAWDRICGIKDGKDDYTYDFIAGKAVLDGTAIAYPGSTTIRKVEGNFPQCKKLLDDNGAKPNEGRGPLMNAKYVADIISSFDLAFSTKDGMCVVETMHGDENFDPITFHGWNQTGEVDGEGVALLMPVRR